MPTIERTFSEFLRHPNEVIDEIADQDIVLRRRDAPALRLSDESRIQQQDQAFQVLASLLRNLYKIDRAVIHMAFKETFPWMILLPRDDQDLFIEEFTQTVRAVNTIDRFGIVGQLVNQWAATAAIHADENLAKDLSVPKDAVGGVIARPSN